MYTTYDIVDDLLDLRSTIERFFSEKPVSARRVDFPYVNLHEKDDTIEITALMPGVKADSLNLQLIDHSLLIEGEKKSDIEDKCYIRTERSFGKFQKTVKLPYAVERDRVEATLKDGVLTVKLLKSEEARPKRIEIK